MSLQLILYAQAVALLFAIPLGIFTAYRAGTRIDKAANTVAFAFISIPTFVLAYFLIYLLAVERDLFPVAGYVPFGEDPAEHFKSMFLPGRVPRRRPDRDLHAAAAQRHDPDAAGGLHHDGPGQGPPHAPHPAPPRAAPVELHAAHGGGINIGALIGGAVVIEVIFQLPGVGAA